MKFTACLAAVALALGTPGAEGRAQLATTFATIPPVSRELYIMEYGADSATFARFTRLRGDTIVFMGLISRGTFTQRELPLAAIARIDMAEPADWQQAGERGAIFGGLAGVALGGGGAAMSGNSIGKPLVVGALAGALVGYILGGQSASVRISCWRTVFQRADADMQRLDVLRRARSSEPNCSTPR